MNSRMSFSTIDRIDRLEDEARQARIRMIRDVVTRLWKGSSLHGKPTLRVGHA